MTVSNTQVDAIFQGDGSTVDFNIPATIHQEGGDLDTAEWEVYVRDTSVTPETEALQVDPTDYSLNTGPDRVTFVTAPASTDQVYIRRVTALTQSLDYSANDNFPGDSEEVALDKIQLQIQNLERRVDRSLRVQRSQTDTVDALFDSDNTRLPGLEGDAYLKTNAAGDGFEFDDSITELGVGVGTGIMAKDAAASAVVRTLTGTTDEIDIANGDGVSGNPTFGISDDAVMPGTGGIKTPNGTTAQRVTGAGRIRWNTDLSQLEYHTGSAWISLGREMPRGVINVGISYASSILKIVQKDGSDFSSDAPGFGIMESQVTPGEIVILEITGTSHLIEDDGGTSDIAGEEFGTTAAVAWGNNRPLYLYICNSDDTASGVAFFLSPDPTLKQSPATANIGYHGNPMATPSDSGAFFMTSTNVTVTHAQKPCMRIGGVRGQKSASDDWTFQTLDESAGDGIRPDPFVGVWFDFPTGQMGADSGQFYEGASGNGPTWATPASITYKYMLDLNGMCKINYTTDGAGDVTNGTDVNRFDLVLPYNWVQANRVITVGGWVSYSGGISGLAFDFVSGEENHVRVLDTSWVTVDYNEWTATGHDIWATMEYQAFGA